jgi:2-polyprenyl-3-methyl-5-hydroxy-6-metoxy-1,4-benzoquinol methylase
MEPPRTDREEIACPLCGAADSHEWGRENGFTARKCDGCGLVYVNPRPSLREITEANSLGQHKTDGGFMDVVFRRDPEKVDRYRRIIKDLFRDRLQRPVCWLDVGAGFGEVVEAVQAVAPVGSRVEGIEPMVKKAEAARKHNVPVTSRTLSEVSDLYDVISMVNVFSHIPDFRRFLSDLSCHLAPGGELLIETGNGGDLTDACQYPDRLYLPDHLVFAGVEHIHRFLDESGFSVIGMRQYRSSGGFVSSAKSLAKRLLRRPASSSKRDASAFRTVFYRARQRNAAAA